MTHPQWYIVSGVTALEVYHDHAISTLFLSGMKEMNYNQSVEIDDANVVDYNHLRRLARMLDISNDDIRESYNTAKRRLGISGVVTKKVFNQNKSRFVDELVYIIVD